MKKIASFTVNHDTLQKGMYISRIDGDVVTYDIRMKRPNMGTISPTERSTHLSTFLPPTRGTRRWRIPSFTSDRWAAARVFTSWFGIP